MLVINKITAPGNIKRIEIRPESVRVTLADGTEQIYHKATAKAAYTAPEDILDMVGKNKQDRGGN